MDYRAAAVARVKEIVAEANEKFDLHLNPSISFTVRGSTAGWARGTTELNFNYQLMVDNWDDFDSTFIHEVAHLVDSALHPELKRRELYRDARTGRVRRSKRSVHGPTWQRIMVRLGADPKRTHNYDVSAVSRRKTRHVWTCACGSKMELGPKRHKNMLSGARRYWMRGHANCGGYTYGGGVKAPELPKAAQTSTQKPTQRGNGSLKDQARELYSRSGRIRGAFISLCESVLGMKKTTASTYFQNFKSGKWS